MKVEVQNEEDNLKGTRNVIKNASLKRICRDSTRKFERRKKRRKLDMI